MVIIRERVAIFRHGDVKIAEVEPVPWITAKSFDCIQIFQNP